MFQSQPLTANSSTIYKDALRDIVQVENPNLTTIRDRAQVYNARRKSDSIVEEYLGVIKRLETQNSVVARFSMSRAEAPVLILSQEHIIGEIKRCCLNTTAQSSRSVLCKFFRKNVSNFSH